MGRLAITPGIRRISRHVWLLLGRRGQVGGYSTASLEKERPRSALEPEWCLTASAKASRMTLARVALSDSPRG